MSELPKHLSELRDEMSALEHIYQPKYGGKDHSGYEVLMKYEVNYEREEAFVNGWNKGIQALAEGAGEFDEKAAQMESAQFCPLGIEMGEGPGRDAFNHGIRMARWQFECDKARIVLETLKRNEVVEMASKFEARLLELRARVNQLLSDADLAEHLRTKLAAAEARCKELEAELLRTRRESNGL